VQQAPITKVISPEEKRQDDIEEAVITRTQELAALLSRPKAPLPRGNSNVADLPTATRRAVRESSCLLLDWTTPEAKMIGNVVKVYWDGDNAWYYARILHYDWHHRMHYIYYVEDSTAEWINLQSETVIVGQEIVLATRQQKWPAQRFQVSEMAAEQLKRMKGYTKNCEYIEYFSDEGLKDYAFVPADSLAAIRWVALPLSPVFACLPRGLHLLQPTNNNPPPLHPQHP